MDQSTTKEQLIAEVHALRQRVADLEACQPERHPIERMLSSQASVLNAVAQAVIATDLDGMIVYWNPFAEKLYGWTATEVHGRNILDVTPSAMLQTHASEIMERLREGKPWSGEFYVQRRDGTMFPVLVSDSPIQDESGRLIGIIGFSVDITERKQLEARLHEETETVETINRVGQLLS
ncbi:MAG TPA: PAS domain S-box protein, partial [Herpetosiphonaceae bacterium]